MSMQSLKKIGTKVLGTETKRKAFLTYNKGHNTVVSEQN